MENREGSFRLGGEGGKEGMGIYSTSEIEFAIVILHEKFNRLARQHGYDPVGMEDFIQWIERKIEEEFEDP